MTLVVGVTYNSAEAGEIEEEAVKKIVRRGSSCILSLELKLFTDSYPLKSSWHMFLNVGRSQRFVMVDYVAPLPEAELHIEEKAERINVVLIERE